MAYLEIAELKTYLGITSAGEDVLVQSLLTDAQTIFESETGGRLFEHSGAATDRYFTVKVHTEKLVLHLDKDLCSITSVYTNFDNGSGGIEIPASEYFTEPLNDTPYYQIIIAGSSTKSWEYTNNPQKAIKVTGKWTYSLSPPNDVRYAVKRLAAFMYRNKDAQVFETIAMPDAGMITIPKGTPRDIIKTIIYYRRLV